jgi:Spy/CpxP family protein refolding chaperone
MTFKGKFLSILVLALGLAGAAYAQDTKTTTTPDVSGKAAAKAQKKFERHAGRALDDNKRGRFGRGEFGGRMGRFESFGHGITLTDAQKQQIRQIHEASKPDPATLQELRTIQDARRSGTLTDAQKARVKELRGQQEGKAKSVRDQIEAILTPEQKAQIQKNQEERKARREQMRERFEQFRKDHKTKPDAKTAPTKPITE